MKGWLVFMKKAPMNEQKICKRILEEMQDLDTILESTDKSTFVESTLLQKATVMTLLNIGELCNKFAPALKDNYPDIPWKAIIGFRNIAAHDYGIIDEDIIWDTVKVDIPVLKENISRVLEDLKGKL